MVYKAWQADLERVVALKFLHTDSQESAERFIREAKIAANLTHPNIAAIYEVGQHEGKLYITMQFVDGVTTNKGSFTLREAVHVIRDACVAVDYAHAHDIIHRDIKPHNIMVAQERSGTEPSETARRTYVMDFGLARTTNKGGTLTTEGQVMGTPAFMSPEQAEGRTCDARSDVYSLGATLYALATGHAPFEANTPIQVLMKVTHEQPVAPSKLNPEIDRNLEAVILKAMAKKQEDRYPSAGRLASDLARWAQGETTDAGPTVQLATPPSTARLQSNSSPSGSWKPRAAAFAAIIAIFVALAGAIAVLTLKSDPKEEPSASVPEEKPPPKENPPEPKPPPPVIPKVAKPLLTLEKPKRKVAFSIDSTPRGARILLDGARTEHRTPHTVYLDDTNRVSTRIQLEKPGYISERRTVQITDKEQNLIIDLSPQTGSLSIRDAAPGSRLHLFHVPKGVKDAAALLSLWSENERTLRRGLKMLEPPDAAYAVARLKELARSEDPAVGDRAGELAKQPPAAEAVAPIRTVRANAAGGSVFEDVPVLLPYRILGTSPAATDFLSPEVRPRYGDDLVVVAEMTGLVLVKTTTRPKVGRFDIVLPGDTLAGQIVPDGPGIRVPAGPMRFRFVPPPDDPLLRPFELSRDVRDPLELTGNVYYHSALRARVEGDLQGAIRGFTEALREKSYPGEEQVMRAALPETIRTLFREWIEAERKKGKSLGGDLAKRAAQLDGKPAADTLALLTEIYTARNADARARGAAAAALALANARLRRPYEAMEWIERAVAENVDPGARTEGEVATAARGVPGLSGRWSAVAGKVARMRKTATRVPGFLGIRGTAVKDRGLRVDALAKEGAALKAGLRFGDLITDFGAAPVRTPQHLAAAEAALAAGDNVEIKGVRGGKPFALRITLAPKPSGTPAYLTPPSDLGVVQYVHPNLGIFVKLRENVQVSAQDVLEVLRAGAVVGRLRVQRVTEPDATYPHGAAQCSKVEGNPLKGDSVRISRE